MRELRHYYNRLLGVLCPEGDCVLPRSGRFDKNVEGVRGFACLCVLFFHWMTKFDPATLVPSPYLFYMHKDRTAVMFFFILSGYVIGLTNTHKPRAGDRFYYFQRRVVRLVPIYWATIILLSVLLLTWDPAWAVIGNMFFLQNDQAAFPGVPLLRSNEALWSLGFTFLYYLLFLFIWGRSVRFDVLLILLLGLEIGSYYHAAISPAVGAYAMGFIFWCLGLWLAWKAPRTGNPDEKHPLVSYVLLISAVSCLNPFDILVSRLGIVQHRWCNLANLAIVPAATVLFVVISRRTFPGLRAMKIAAFVVPSITGLVIILSGRLGDLAIIWRAGFLYLGMAFAFLPLKMRVDVFGRLSYLGSISYALYIVHLPIMYTVSPSGAGGSGIVLFAAKTLLWFSICLILAHLLERVMQPRVAAWHRTRFPRARNIEAPLAGERTTVV